MSTPPAWEPLTPPTEETARSAFWTALGGLGFISGAAYLVFCLLAWTGQVPLGEPLAISCGVMLLVTGVFSLREAVDKTADRPKWARSNVKVGRLSALAFGIGSCAIGTVFLGYGWLPERYGVWATVVFLASFALGLLGQWIDGRAYEASRTAIRRRGWLLASRRADDDLPADEIHRRQEARATLRRFIQGRLTGRTTWERVEAQCRYLADPARDLAAPTDWPEVADEWRAFRSAAAKGDELWGFNTVSARGDRDCGEEGFALLRDGTVVDCFITLVVG